MKDYYYYVAEFKKGENSTVFDEFIIFPSGEYTQEEVHESVYTRAYGIALERGLELESFTFENSHELDYVRWEKKRLQEQDTKASLERSLDTFQSFNHQGK
ncbi:hypothetical protein K8O68_07745 [Salipaludibacillus sp. CUR1]|uniref:hypothetical protein n=1 Tax=Salipaludibacillus sp. CUR1 TaxID=2820003 RepID=UPI001E4D8D85|nr:hypothetical protein [Salipaludibacillus sp. CUR1]MCE7792312.1 hypothetical protein [Salipaludibacillus sp. CUR1]